MPCLSHVARILLLEDDGMIALHIETTLVDAGVGEVVYLARIEDALRAIEASSFNAAILDLRIGARGWAYDVAGRLRQKGIPFIFSSGAGEVMENYRDVPLVMKPFSSDQLIAALVDVTTVSAAAVGNSIRAAVTELPQPPQV
jgi:DNA-binding response OmpR family regulator